MERDTYVSQPAADAGCSTALEYPDIFYGAGHLRLTTSSSTLHALLLWNIRTFSLERDTYVSQPAADAGCSTALEYQDIFCGAGHLRLATSRRRWLLYCSGISGHFLWSGTPTSRNQPLDAACSTALEYQDIFYRAGHLRLTNSSSTLHALLLWNIRTFSIERDTYVSQPAARHCMLYCSGISGHFPWSGTPTSRNQPPTLAALLLWNIRTFSVERDTYVSQPATDAGCSTALEYQDIFYGAGHLRLATSRLTLPAQLLWNIRTFSMERDTYVSQPAADAGCSTALEYQDIFCGAGHLRLATSRRRWLLYCSGISGHFLSSGTPTSHNQQLDTACSTALEYQDIFLGAGHLRLATSRRRWLLYCSGISGHFLWSGTPTSRNQPPTLAALLLWNIRTFPMERDTYVLQPAARRCLLNCSGISGHFLWSGTPTSHNQQLDTACSTALEYQDIFLGAGHLRLATSRRRWLLYCFGISGHFLWSGTPASRNQPPRLAALLLWNIRTFSMERDTYVSQPAARRCLLNCSGISGHFLSSGTPASHNQQLDTACSTALEYQDIFLGAGHLRLATSRRRWLLYCSGISGHFLWSGTPTSRNQPPTLAAPLLWNIRTFSVERDTCVSQPAADAGCSTALEYQDIFYRAGHLRLVTSRRRWLLYCSGISGHFLSSGTPTSHNQQLDTACSTALEYQDIFYRAGHLRLTTSSSTLHALLLWNIRTFSLERDTYVSQPAADAGCSTALDYQDIFCGAGHLRLATSRPRWLLHCSGISGHFLWSGTPTSRNQPLDAACSTALEYQDIFLGAGHLRLATSRRRWLLYCSGISGHFLWSGTPTSRKQPPTLAALLL